MMNVQIILQILGKPSEHPAVKQVMQAFGAKCQPERDEDEEDAVTEWLPIQKEGIEFGFAVEGSLKGEKGKKKFSGPFILQTIIFYCNFEGMSSYQGELPLGLKKTDNSLQVETKLLQYNPVRKSYIRDVWELADYRLIIAYTTDRRLIESVLCELRPYPYAKPLPKLPTLPTMEQIIGCLGKPARSKEFLSIFARFNIAKYQNDIFEDHEADLRLDYGFEIYFCPGTDIGLKQKRLVWAGIKYYRDRDLDARGWEGELPFGLLLDDDQNTMLKKVGFKPIEQQDDNLDGFALWHLEKFSLHVYYSNLENRIYRLMVLAPGYWQSLD